MFKENLSDSYSIRTDYDRRVRSDFCCGTIFGCLTDQLHSQVLPYYYAVDLAYGPIFGGRQMTNTLCTNSST